MESRISILMVVLLMFPLVVSADDFADALKEIDRLKPNINYHTFCKEIAQGGQEKIACRVKKVPTVAFLVCKEEEYCEKVIRAEVRNIETLRRAGINTVRVSTTIITGVRCGVEKSTDCSGFLEEWISQDKGTFAHLRDAMAHDKINDVIATVVKYTTHRGLRNSAKDLDNIMAYMKKDGSSYRQICDLQGFFMKTGGFKVNDVPMIRTGMTLNDKCDSSEPGEPTTATVLKDLQQMSEAFKKY